VIFRQILVQIPNSTVMPLPQPT